VYDLDRARAIPHFPLVQVDCNILDEIEEIEEKRTPKKNPLNQQTASTSAGYSYDDSDGAIIAPPVTATISKQESNEVRGISQKGCYLEYFLNVR
jgi:hypothetical protein